MNNWRQQATSAAAMRSPAIPDQADRSGMGGGNPTGEQSSRTRPRQFEWQLWWRSLLGLGRREPRRLRLAETLALGDRRFVAVVEYEHSRFLVGGTSSSLVLLARLESPAKREAEENLPKKQNPVGEGPDGANQSWMTQAADRAVAICEAGQR